MTEIEQLKNDLETLVAAKKVQKTGLVFGWYLQSEIARVADKIADLEAQQAQTDEWWAVKDMIGKFSDDYYLKKYVRHLEAKVAELENELRCERIDGGKVRDDRKAIDAEKSREKLAELTTILNAIPLYRLEAACGLAKELVEKQIEAVKKEMQGNGN